MVHDDVVENPFEEVIDLDIGILFANHMTSMPEKPNNRLVNDKNTAGNGSRGSIE